MSLCCSARPYRAETLAKGDKGPKGDPGDEGKPGSDGLSARIDQRPLDFGDEHCPAGGVEITSHLDVNGDGVFDAGFDSDHEVEYVCAVVSLPPVGDDPPLGGNEVGCTGPTAPEVRSACERMMPFEIFDGVTGIDSCAEEYATLEQIAMLKNPAEQEGITIGMPDGTFSPDASATTGLSLGWLAGILYHVKPDLSKRYPAQILAPAKGAGLLTEADACYVLPRIDQPLTRAWFFYFYDESFGSKPLPDDGRTLYEAKDGQPF